MDDLSQTGYNKNKYPKTEYVKNIHRFTVCLSVSAICCYTVFHEQKYGMKTCALSLIASEFPFKLLN